jgi:hypothetical protein
LRLRCRHFFPIEFNHKIIVQPHDGFDP